MLSVSAHTAFLAVALRMGAQPIVAPVEIELKEVPVRKVEEFPLGGARGGARAEPHARARPGDRARKAATETSTLDPHAGSMSTTGSSPSKDQAGRASASDIGDYGPKGSRLIILMRLDRVRGTEYQAAIDRLSQHISDRRDLLRGTGLDLFEDFDALLVATPSPGDRSVTFLAARHHLDQAAMRDALSRGAESSSRTLRWQEEGGRLVGERRALEDGGLASNDAVAPPDSSDDRLFVLSEPGLAIVAPPAYRALLLGPAAATPGTPPDGGLAADEADAGAVSAQGWSTLFGRIETEEGTMPATGVVMVKVFDLLSWIGSSSGRIPLPFEMEVPPALSVTIGVEGTPFLDLVAEFRTEVSARQWETQWPALQRQLRAHLCASLLGLSSLIDHATLSSEGNIVRIHLGLTRPDTVWLLGLALQQLASRGT